MWWLQAHPKWAKGGEIEFRRAKAGWQRPAGKDLRLVQARPGPRVLAQCTSACR